LGHFFSSVDGHTSSTLFVSFYPLREKEVDHPRRRQAPKGGKNVPKLLAGEMTRAAAAKKKGPKNCIHAEDKKKGERDSGEEIAYRHQQMVRLIPSANEMIKALRKKPGGSFQQKYVDGRQLLKRMGGGGDGGVGGPGL
jgi:hypothetical protein